VEQELHSEVKELKEKLDALNNAALQKKDE